MQAPYEERLADVLTLRLAPGPRHELVCARLLAALQASVAKFPGTKLLGLRTEVRFSPSNWLRPDLGVAAAATGKLWLAAEVISADDHHTDTVLKKQLYEDLKVARLWMVDPRYDNLEVYHATAYGLKLHGILAGRDVLAEPLLPEFRLSVAELFAPAPNPN